MFVNDGAVPENSLHEYNIAALDHIVILELHPVKGEVGFQNQQFIANLGNYIAPGGGLSNNAYITFYVGGKKVDSFDPRFNGFFVRRVWHKKLTVLTRADNAGPTYATMGQQQLSAHWSHSFRLPEQKYENEGDILPSTPCPAIMIINYYPFNVVSTYTYKMVWVDV